MPEAPRPKPTVVDLEAIKAAVAQELSPNTSPEPTAVEVMEKVLARAPQGLTDPEIAKVAEACRVPLSSMQIQYVIHQAGKGRFERYGGRVFLMKPTVRVNMRELEKTVGEQVATQIQWTKIEAIRCVLSRAGTGLTVPQLSEALNWFGIQLSPDSLKVDIRRYVQQIRLQVFHGVVTLPQTEPSWKLRVEDKEPTPNLASIRDAVCRGFAALANQSLTNVELVEFILGHTPDGLWNEEFMEITKVLGVDFKESCINSVTTKETKGRFLRKNGRVSLIGPAPTRVTKDDLRTALKGKGKVAKFTTKADLFIEVLSQFPDGLHLLDLQAAVVMCGHRSNYDAVKRRVYYLGTAGRLCVHNGHAVVTPS